MRCRTVGRSRRRAVVRVLSSLALVAVVAGWAGPAGAAVHSNTAAITIPSTGADGKATPYPSTISVAASGQIADVNVSLTNLTHVYPSDLDVLLVGPTGESVVLMADTGGNTPIAGLNFTLDDAASASLPVSTPITGGGTYKPTNGSVFNGGAPAPVGPFGTTLSVFNGTDAAGTWSLYAFDDFSTSGGGSIAGGWSLDIALTSVTSFTPAAGAVGDTVTVTGTGLTGAAAVKFGTTPVTTFTVDSDTQITATVPPGAHSGPIAITVSGATVKSETDFVVNHARSVSLTLNGKKGKGSVDSLDGFTPCAFNVAVKVQRRVKHRWRAVAGDFTGTDGSYTVIGLVDRGKYRALAKPITLPSGDVCLQAISAVVKK